MGLAVQSGHANYSSTGTGNTSKFIPVIWSTKLVEKFYASTVFADISNTDYEGEIKAFGDKVMIRTIPTITVRNYTKGAGLTYEEPESANVELDIDQGKYFAFSEYTVDKFQSDLSLMNMWAEDGGQQMKIAIDTDILAGVYSSAPAANSGATAGAKSGNINLGTHTTPVALTKTNILDFIVDCGTVLDEQNIPETNRWIVLPARACGLIKKSDLKDASLSGDGTSILRNGRLGMIDRFTIYSSNNVHVGTSGDAGEYDLIFGHKSAITFAAQITEMEEVQMQNDFGKFIRSLMVYGYEVANPKSLGYSVATVS